MTTVDKISILIYNGPGASPSAVSHARRELHRLLAPRYAVSIITAETLLNEPWQPSTACLVFPGGGDLGYCRALNGEGNRKIRRYVENGGKYIGFCAGGYYGCSSCEFEVGSKGMEVVGSRELAFFPGACRGSAFKGFEYNSDSGTLAARLKVRKEAFALCGEVPGSVRTYANGGGMFEIEGKRKCVEVLAEYDGTIDVERRGDHAAAAAAVVWCKVGEGAALLTGPHPEFSAKNISPHAKGLQRAVYGALDEDDQPRSDFLKACLTKLGLEVNCEDQKPPSLTTLHLSSSDLTEVEQILKDLEEVSSVFEGEDYIKAEQDTFLLQRPESPWSMTKLTRAALDIASKAVGAETQSTTSVPTDPARPTDSPTESYTQTIKTLVAHDTALPTTQTTPYFNHEAYFTALAPNQPFGRPLIYAQTVTSTSTLLEKNPTLTSRLPLGTVCTATTQLSGRGRGSNIWVSPPGALMFSTKFTHPLSLSATAPVVFIQYLAAMAVVRAVKSYDADPRFAKLPVRLKWPNDIYAAITPGVGNVDGRTYAKIGGVLVNTSYSGSDYNIILGIGLNLSNASPTTSLNALIAVLNAELPSKAPLAPMTAERLLARVVTCFGELYDSFKAHGFAGELEEEYYSSWLHTGQVVTLENEGGARARIEGISRDWGLLVAEEVDEGDYGGGVDGVTEQAHRGSKSLIGGGGRKFALQSDSNSFDFLKGLVRRKL